MEKRPVLWISVAGLVFFGALHAWLRFEGSTDTEIQNVLIGWFVFAGFCSFFSAMWHGGGFGAWLFLMVPVSLCCGASILAISQPLLAAGILVVTAALYAWLTYLQYLNTPYGHNHRPVREIPGFGAIVVNGKTPRQVRAEVNRLKKEYGT